MLLMTCHKPGFTLYNLYNVHTNIVVELKKIDHGNINTGATLPLKTIINQLKSN